MKLLKFDPNLPRATKAAAETATTLTPFLELCHRLEQTTPRNVTSVTLLVEHLLRTHNQPADRR